MVAHGEWMSRGVLDHEFREYLRHFLCDESKLTRISTPLVLQVPERNGS